MPGYRGRLIFPQLARLGRVDLSGIAGPQTSGEDSGFDPVFREPIRLQNGTQEGESARRELEPLDMKCQVEDEVWEQVQMLATGNSPLTRLTLIFHYRDLEEQGLVDAETGEQLAPRVGDRLISMHKTDSTLIRLAPPRLYCIQAVDRSFGLSGGGRNLLACVFETRETAQPQR